MTPNTPFIMEEAAAGVGNGDVGVGGFNKVWPTHEFPAVGITAFQALLGAVHGMYSQAALANQV